jgi:hypothetical protein
MSLTKLSLGGNYLNYCRPGRVLFVTSRLGAGKTITFFTVYCPDQRCVIFILDKDIEPIQLSVGVSIVPGLAVQQELQPVLLPAPDRKYSLGRLIVK